VTNSWRASEIGLIFHDSISTSIPQGNLWLFTKGVAWTIIDPIVTASKLRRTCRVD